MQSKTAINILAFIALIGMIAFLGLNLIGSFEKNLVSKKIQESPEIIDDISKITKNAKQLEFDLIDLKERKEVLEGTISEKLNSEADLDEKIQVMNDKKVLIMAELTVLEKKRDQTHEIVSDLVIQANNKKLSQIKKTDKLTQNIESVTELMAVNKQLRIENTNLEGQLEDFESYRQDLIDIEKNKIQDLSDKLNIKSEEIKTTKALQISENKKFITQVNALVADNNRLLIEIKKNNERIDSNKATIGQKEEIFSQNNKELEDLKNLKLKFEQLNGLRVIFSGNLVYDESNSQIVFRAENSIGIPIFQDDFTGSIAGKCGLPIDIGIKDRCTATIIAEFVVENNGLFLRGREIVEIIKK